MTTHYPRLTQLLTLGLHLRETQRGPVILRESLGSVCVYHFLQRNFEGYQHLLSIFANLPLPHSYLTKLVCEHHIKASSDFAARILADSEHPLHEELSNARSHPCTRSRFKLLSSKTAAYRNSVLPALSRLLVDRNAELNFCIQELS